MNANQGTVSASEVTVNDLPEPHTCPWLLQYFLALPIRRLVESPERVLSHYIAPGMTVLEPGCGFGFFTLPMARMVGPEGKVVSVDIEPRAIEKLKRKAAIKGLVERLDARSCGPRDLGLTDYRGRIDLAVVMHMLHELEDIPEFLGQVTALLKPGGKMLIAEPKGHVSPKSFAAELSLCRQAGFTEIDQLSRIRGRWAALFCSSRPGAI
jgi:2-polyprenyl-3-methyl-5-hydroxy-6-metoxy-1,4-benzoquinol methylase